ncbi:hypothetical protein ACEXQE_18635 [Herbiconiux sp. P17]|uniref:hypothetical protein n=1 Tax=Herbiconiux wuyangfengii TaxID=3342794 RepID=UPI0035BB0FE2
MNSKIIPAEIAAQIPHRTDTDVAELVSSLVGVAIRQQVWLMFFDENECPMPLIVPYADLDPDPSDEEIAKYAALACGIARTTGAASIVLTWERPGGSALDDSERRLLRAISAGIAGGGVAVRSVFLSHSHGVVHVAEESS